MVPGRTMLFYRNTSSVLVLLVQVFSRVMTAHSTEKSFMSLDMDCHTLGGHSKLGASWHDSSGTEAYSRLPGGSRGNDPDLNRLRARSCTTGSADPGGKW